MLSPPIQPEASCVIGVSTVKMPRRQLRQKSPVSAHIVSPPPEKSAAMSVTTFPSCSGAAGLNQSSSLRAGKASRQRVVSVNVRIAREVTGESAVSMKSAGVGRR